MGISLNMLGVLDLWQGTKNLSIHNRANIIRSINQHNRLGINDTT